MFHSPVSFLLGLEGPDRAGRLNHQKEPDRQIQTPGKPPYGKDRQIEDLRSLEQPQLETSRGLDRVRECCGYTQGQGRVEDN